jgi:hypothetical protein
MNRESFGGPSFRFSGFFSSLCSMPAMRRKEQTNPWKYRIGGILALFTFLVFLPLSAKAALLFSNNYEDGTYGNVTRCGSSWTKCPSGYQSVPNTTAMGINSKIAGTGARSVINIARPYWPVCYIFNAGPYINNPICDRSEFEKNTLPTTGTDERWYSFSAYIDPSTVYKQSTDPNGPIVFQLHQMGGTCGSGPGPHFVIYFTFNGHWTAQNIWDTTRPCPSVATFHSVKYDLGAATRGVWTNFVVHAKWSTGSNGLLQVWMNGKLLVGKTGPNTFNNIVQETVKWGVYQPWWIGHAPAAGEQIVVLHDNIKVGDANSSYAEVASQTQLPVQISAPTNLSVLLGQ